MYQDHECSHRYGRNRHAIAVLIDYHLGGGVKDCWPSEDPDRIRAHWDSDLAYLGILQYESDEVYDILARAP